MHPDIQNRMYKLGDLGQQVDVFAFRQGARILKNSVTGHTIGQRSCYNSGWCGYTLSSRSLYKDFTLVYIYIYIMCVCVCVCDYAQM
jgi:hypothetical protein